MLGLVPFDYGLGRGGNLVSLELLDKFRFLGKEGRRGGTDKRF